MLGMTPCLPRHVARTAALAAALAAASCQSPPRDDAGRAGVRSPLTAGMVKKTITRRKTTQADILEVFGPPDWTQIKEGGREIWTYDKVTNQIEETSGYWTVLLAGGGKTSVESSSRSSMVIIYFDDKEVVEDFRLSVVRY